MSLAVDATGLYKRFGSVEAVRGVDLRIPEGGIYGLIGPNGAGKTTTIRMILGILRPDRGSVRIFGETPLTARRRGWITYLPEQGGVYKNLTGLDFLRYIARLYYDSEEAALEAVERGIEISGLRHEDLKRIMRKYSKGMQRRILLAAVLMVNPRLVILDEPTSGLDVVHSVAVRRNIKEYASNGGTVLLSSHNMLEVEYLCSRVWFMKGGRIIDEGSPGELKDKYSAENLEEAFLNALRQEEVVA